MKAGNPIVGGVGTIIRTALQSFGFLSGAQGWIVRRDGTAEFNSLTLRGKLIIQSSTQGVFVYSGAPAAGNLIVSLANANGTDPYGNNYPQGFSTWQAGSSENAYVQIRTLPARPIMVLNPDLTQCGVDGAVSVNITGSPAISNINMVSPKMGLSGTSALLALFSSGASGTPKADALLTTDYTAPNPGSPLRFNGAWQFLALNAGFQGAGTLANGTDPAYRYVASSRIELRGQWQPSPAGAITSGAVPITLPAGLSPVAGSYYFASATSSTASTVNGRTRIGTGGAVQFNFVGATAPTWAGLDGIGFDLT